MSVTAPLAREAVELIERSLEPGEQVTAIIEGAYGNAVVGTDRRLLVFKKSTLGGATRGPSLAGWRYDEVRNVELRKTFTSLTVAIDAPALPEHEAWKPRSVMLQVESTRLPKIS